MKKGLVVANKNIYKFLSKNDLKTGEEYFIEDLAEFEPNKLNNLIIKVRGNQFSTLVFNEQIGKIESYNENYENIRDNILSVFCKEDKEYWFAYVDKEF